MEPPSARQIGPQAPAEASEMTYQAKQCVTIWTSPPATSIALQNTAEVDFIRMNYRNRRKRAGSSTRPIILAHDKLYRRPMEGAEHCRPMAGLTIRQMEAIKRMSSREIDKKHNRRPALPSPLQSLEDPSIRIEDPSSFRQAKESNSIASSLPLESIPSSLNPSGDV